LKLFILPIVSIAILSFFAPRAFSAPLPDVSMGGVNQYHLANRLMVLLIRDPGASNVTVNVVYRVGSSDEKDGERGLAHLLEHLLFKGTPSHPDIPSEIASRGGRANGNTWTDRTCYFQTLPARLENLRWALSLESERMTKARITAEELDKERGVVINELVRGENDPISVLMNRMESVAFDWHSYGKPTIGNRMDLERLSLDRVLDFYRSFVRPDNGALIISSPFEDEVVLKEVERFFGSIEVPSYPVPRMVSQELGQDGERMVKLYLPGQYGAVGLVYHGPAGSSRKAAAFQVLMEIMGAEPSGRLYRDLVMKGVAGAVWAGAFMFRDSSTAIALAQLPGGSNPESALAAMIDSVEGRRGFTAEEVHQAKQRILKRMDLKYASPDELAVELTEWVARGDWRLFFVHRSRVEDVTAEEVNALAERYLVKYNRTAGIFEPSSSDVRVMVPSGEPIGEEELRRAAESPLMEGESLGVTLDEMERRVQRFTLGGLKVGLIDKRTRGGWVYARLGLEIGNPEDLKGKALVGELMGRYLGRGAGGMSREELDRAFDEMRALVSFSGSPTGVTVDLKAPSENFGKALDLVALCLKEPRFSKEQLKTLKLELRSEIEDQMDDPSALAEEVLDEAFNPYPKGDVRRPLTMKERLEGMESVGLNELKAFHRQFFGLSEGQLGVVGPVDGDWLRKKLEDLFSGWSPKVRYRRVEYPFVPVEGGVQRVQVNGKPNATVAAWSPVRINQESPDYPDLLVAVNVLGGGWLDSRLARRIRHHDGTSYGVRLSLRVFDPDDSGRLEFWAIASPKDVPRVKESFKEELRRALNEGFSSQEVERAKSFILEGVKVDRSQDSRLPRQLEKDLFLGRDFLWHRAMEEAISKVTPDSALKALRRHLSGEGAFLIVEAGSFE
jgi:zinc protease